jgi:hypothetical protein
MNASSTYYVLSAELAQNLDYSVLTDNSYETTRKSLDGTLVIIEHDGSASLSGGTEYTFSQASLLMLTDDWLAEDELDGV